MFPVSKKKVAEDILTKLGAPFVQVELTDQQVLNAIDDAAVYFVEYDERFRVPGDIIHQITEAEAAQGYITLPSSVYVVKDIFMSGQLTFPSNGIIGVPGFSFPFMVSGLPNTVFLTNATNMNGLDAEVWSYGPSYNGDLMSRISMNQNWFSIIRTLMGGRHQIQWKFDRFSKRLYSDEFRDKAGATVLVKVMNNFMIVHSPDDAIPYLSYPLFQDYAEALALEQFYKNFAKFGDVQLPGGNTFSPDAKLVEIGERISALEETIRERSFTYSQLIIQ